MATSDDGSHTLSKKAIATLSTARKRNLSLLENSALPKKPCVEGASPERRIRLSDLMTDKGAWVIATLMTRASNLYMI